MADGKRGVFLPANLEKKSRYGASELGSCEDRQKIIKHFLLTLQNFFYLFFLVFFGSRLFFLQNSWRFFLPKFRTKNFSNDASTWPTWWTPVPASCSIGRGPWHFSGERDCIPRLSKARLLQRKSPVLEKMKMCNNVMNV